MECGPTCLKMVAEHYGRKYSLQNLRGKSFITSTCSIDRRAGVSMSSFNNFPADKLGISDAAEAIGFWTMGVKASLKKMAEEHPMPFIAHWKQNHFVVVYKIKKVRAIRSVTLSRTPVKAHQPMASLL